jgi:hypothetical protein
VDTRSGIDEQLDSFRRARRDIEASVLPLATSLDGRRFTFQASLYALQLQVGAYAVLEDGGVLRLGRSSLSSSTSSRQTRSRSTPPTRAATGPGHVGRRAGPYRGLLGGRGAVSPAAAGAHHSRIALAGVREQSPRWRDTRRPRFGESAEHPRIREIEDGAMTAGDGMRGGTR